MVSPPYPPSPYHPPPLQTLHSALPIHPTPQTSLLRALIASPRIRHPDSNLDLCYVTPFLIATSGPSATYPSLAYRNPLDRLVAYLDAQHGEEWCIWEFRGEGAGYGDQDLFVMGRSVGEREGEGEEGRGGRRRVERIRVRHAGWPDHHPPPFGVLVGTSGRGEGGDEDGGVLGQMKLWLQGRGSEQREKDAESSGGKENENGDGYGRVVIVHCKAGKGRSGTAACAYLIAHCGWSMADALQRFTERRMRPGFGAGVSIPSQLRWVGYVDRWARGARGYREGKVEVKEVHVWGLRDGVRVSVEGYLRGEGGWEINCFHVFRKEERMGEKVATKKLGKKTGGPADGGTNTWQSEKTQSRNPIIGTTDGIANGKAPEDDEASTSSSSPARGISEDFPGGNVIFRPSAALVLPTKDVKLDFERRNKAGYGWNMVTSVAHVWFNAFFEGGGAENGNHADDSGVFELRWEAMDGIKGSSRKGIRAFDRLAVVWEVVSEGGTSKVVEPVIEEPKQEDGSMQSAAIDGEERVQGPLPVRVKDVGLRPEIADNLDTSKASSVQSADLDLVVDEQEEEKERLGLKAYGSRGESDIKLPGEVNNAAA